MILFVTYDFIYLYQCYWVKLHFEFKLYNLSRNNNYPLEFEIKILFPIVIFNKTLKNNFTCKNR